MIGAIILAAGESRRMGEPKMLMTWKGGTVLGHVISVFQNTGAEEIIVVTGAGRKAIEDLAKSQNVKTTQNDNFKDEGMLSSIQCGIRAMNSRVEAVLIALGDQPQVQERTVRMICERYRKAGSMLIVPSHQRRRGHPWLLARPLWTEILTLTPASSARDFLNSRQELIDYVDVNDPSVLADLDTPDDYKKWHGNKS